MGNDYKILLQAILDTTGIGKSDLAPIQKVLDKYPLNLTVDLNKDELLRSIRQIGPELESEFKKIPGLDIQIDDSKILKIFDQVNAELAKNTANAVKSQEEFASSIEKVYQKLGKVQNSELNKAGDSAQKSSQLGLSVLDRFKNTWEKLSGESFAKSVFSKVFSELKNGVKFVDDMDNALTKINYTMNGTKGQLKELGNSSIDLAKDLNTSTTNVLNAVAAYATANATAQDTINKVKPALMLSNVSGMSVEDTSKLLQGTLEQFGLAEDQMLHVSDVIEKVSQGMDMDFSKGIQEISAGIETSGSVAVQAGYSLENYTAILGNLIAKTHKSGSELGQFLRTMMARTSNASKSAYANGEVSDEDISNAEAALKRIGVEVKKNNDSFKDFDTIIREVAGRLDTLSDVELSDLAFNMANTGDISQFKAMIESYNEYLNLAKQANSADGTTFSNQERYAKSLEGALGRLKASSEDFFHTVIADNALKDIVNDGSNALGVLTSLVDQLGLLNTLAVGVGGVLGFKNLGYANTII